MRTQFVPFPRSMPLQPSSFHIFTSPLSTDPLYSFRPAPWTWKRILRRSRGETTVRETAPATPPARKAATTGWASDWRARIRKGSGFASASSSSEPVTVLGVAAIVSTPLSFGSGDRLRLAWYDVKCEGRFVSSSKVRDNDRTERRKKVAISSVTSRGLHGCREGGARSECANAVSPTRR